ncbi:MAG: DoxX family protein [Rhodospirillales bacterium]|nr:DoxX family protein [Rhodospirillales bacterium]
MRNTTTKTRIATSRRPEAAALIRNVLQWLEAVPYALLALPLRLGVATVFWNSAMAKLANWDTTLYMFAEEYKVPILPPEVAANLALAIELTTPVLLVLGFGTRLTAVALLGMTAVIQTFVYPGAWPTHIQWVAMLLVLLARGAGTISVDHLLRRRFFRTTLPESEAQTSPSRRG